MLTSGLLFLMLLVIACIADVIVRIWWTQRREASRVNTPPSASYFEGLNYLLDEQRELAIDAIAKVLPVNDDSVETHLLLGRLVRRQGDTTKAILMHRQLLGEPNISRGKRAQIELELGRDYMSAGLLERAEALLRDAARHGGAVRGEATELLLDVYQRDRNWARAVEAGEAMGELRGELGPLLAPRLAHFLCELADASLLQGDMHEARRFVQRALGKDNRCVRAWLLIARIEQHEQNHRAAVNALRSAVAINPRFVREILDAMDSSYQALHAEAEFLRFLDNLVTTVPSCTAMVRRAEYYEREAGSRAAREFVEAQLVRRPSVRGLHALLRFHPANAEDANVLLLRRFTDAMLAGKPVYRCDSCGLALQTLHWACPSCRAWGTVAPILGLEGD